jgi:hypothetical protein
MARSFGLKLLGFFFVCALILVCGLLTCGTTWASGTLEVKGDLALSSPLIGPLDSQPSLLLAQKAIEEPTPTAKKEGEEPSQTEKSQGKAFIFSALVPGSGELYVGAKRGYIFLGVEAVAWTSSYFFHKSGKQKEDEYLDFADNHWSFERLPPIGGTCSGSPYTADRDSLIRYFYEHNKQHFYEDIGKQPFYQCGWDSPQNLGSYLDMRDKSNWLLKNSDYAIMAALVNHVVSAIDALRLARNYNANLGHGMKLNLKLKTSPHSSGIILVASRKF